MDIIDKGKQNKYPVTLLKAAVLALLPWVCCLVYCAIQGYQLKNVYLPSSEWNDELFYYKQVESILNYGYPMGYFGYNESHALKLSFAAWSPVLMFPWIIWGLLFGWNLMSPIICNIMLMSLACCLFVLLVRPTWKQLISVALLFCLYTPFIRYMLSGMTEIICFSTLIIFYSLVFNYLHRKRRFKLFLLFVLSGIITLMRPYFVLFILLPAYFWIHGGTRNKNKISRALGSFVFIVMVLGVYAFINRYLGAAYFGPLFSTDWISEFFSKGLFGGIYFTAKKLYINGVEFFKNIIEALHSGLYAGTFYAGYMVCLIMLFFQFFKDWQIRRKLQENVEDSKDEPISSKEHLKITDKLAVEIHWIFSLIVMIFALLLMYKIPDGGRHFSVFIAADIFVMTVLADTRFYAKTMITAVTFAYLYIGMIHYQIPFEQAERTAAINEWHKVLSASLTVDTQAPPNYENVVIWTLGDMVNGKPAATFWQLLYALPEGFGISCCTYDYVAENFDSLQSRYIYVVQGGTIEENCIRSGHMKIMEGDGMVLYQRS